MSSKKEVSSNPLPQFLLSIYLASEFLYLAGLRFFSEDYFLISASAIALLALLVLLSKNHVPDFKPQNLSFATIAVLSVLLFAGIKTYLDFGLLTTLLGMKPFLFLFICIQAIKLMDLDNLNRLKRIVGLFFILNAAVSLIQLFLPLSTVLTLFPEAKYGVNIKQIAGTLRAPGLMRDNQYLGLAAALFILHMRFDKKSHFEKIGKVSIFEISVLLSCAVCIYASYSRSAILIFLAFITIQLSRVKKEIFSTILAIGMGVYFLIFMNSQYSSILDSRNERLELWKQLLSKIGFLGDGLGATGAATGSRFANDFTFYFGNLGYSRVGFSDNYYISILTQVGWISGFVLFAATGLLIAQYKNKLEHGEHFAYFFRCGTLLIVVSLIDLGEYTMPLTLGYLSWKVNDGIFRKRVR